MNLNALKQAAAEAALEQVQYDMTIGIGTGSTVNYFIAALAKIKSKVKVAVSSSQGSTQQLKAFGIPVTELNNVSQIDLYVDGADEVNAHKQMIKGGGGALTGEKIIATAAKKFICIADRTKQVDVLGKFPVAVEVIPLARSYVARELVKMGGQPIYREGFVTDYGNIILDVYNWQIMKPLELETQINQIPGVVTNGIFAHRPADMVIIGGEQGIKTLT